MNTYNGRKVFGTISEKCLKAKTPLEVMIKNNQFKNIEKIKLDDIIKVENKYKIKNFECPT